MNVNFDLFFKVYTDLRKDLCKSNMLLLTTVLIQISWMQDNLNTEREVSSFYHLFYEIF